MIEYFDLTSWSVRVLTDITTADQCGTGTNCNDGVLYIPWKTGASDSLVQHPGHLLVGGLPLSRKKYSYLRCSL